jgi:hypothetical protein
VDQIPSYEADVSSDGEEIFRFIHYRVYNVPPTWDILILSSHLRLGLPSGVFSSGFPTNIQYVFISFPTGATYPAHLILDFVNWMLFNVMLQIAKIIMESTLSCFFLPPGYSTRLYHSCFWASQYTAALRTQFFKEHIFECIIVLLPFHIWHSVVVLITITSISSEKFKNIIFPFVGMRPAFV